MAEEFAFNIDYPSEEAEAILEPALVLSLVRKERDPHSGLVTLLFNIIFAPFRPLRYECDYYGIIVTQGTNW